MYQHNQSSLNYVGVTTECASFEMKSHVGRFDFSNPCISQKSGSCYLCEIWHNAQEASLQP